mmetsp:Transcript_15001/g.29234  ORF Transcript_15001/g.29234 Transcript_15001/m.29234 type:complete len:96 (+) Transcript_15001:182-469(+)
MDTLRSRRFSSTALDLIQPLCEVGREPFQHHCTDCLPELGAERKASAPVAQSWQKVASKLLGRKVPSSSLRVGVEAEFGVALMPFMGLIFCKLQF